jgi:sugar phosphate isomerase/epimerase
VPRWKPMFSVSQFSTYHLTLDQEIELLTRAGITAIDVAERKLHPNLDIAERQIKRIRESGLTVSGFVPRVHAVLPDSLSPEIRDPAVRGESFRASMRFVRKCFDQAAPVILTITGAAQERNYATAHTTIVAEYAGHASLAEDLGLRIAFEPLNAVFMNSDTTICTWANAIELCGQIDSPSFGLAFDTWHVWDEHDIWGQLDRSFDRVYTVHVSDWIRGGPRSFGDRGIPGEGQVDWQSFAEVLRSHRYDGPVTLEIFSEDHLEGSYWRSPPDQLVDRSRAFLSTVIPELR